MVVSPFVLNEQAQNTPSLRVQSSRSIADLELEGELVYHWVGVYGRSVKRMETLG
jgi:hypothetical protein